MAVRFAPSSARHGITEERALSVLTNHVVAWYAEDMRDGADRIMFLGMDSHGVALEVLAIESSPGDLLVIHAMKMRTSYEAELKMVFGWQKRS